MVVPVAPRHEPYAATVIERLRRAGVDAETVTGAGSLHDRIRQLQRENVSYVLVVGDTDVEHDTVGIVGPGMNAPERDVPLDVLVARVAASP